MMKALQSGKVILHVILVIEISGNYRILVILVVEFVFSILAILCHVCLWTMLPDNTRDAF